jgi:RHS repeat-associated protein
MFWLLGASLAWADLPRSSRILADSFQNDAAHRLIAITDPLQRPTVFAYDNDSHQTNAMDAMSNNTAQFWNARGNLVKVIDAASNVVGRAYDGAGNLIFLTNRNSNVWTFQYDGANRLTNTISPLGHSSSRVYNNRGLLQSTTDPLLQTTSFGYDARARMASKTDSLGTNNYQYDGNNNLTLLTNLGTGVKLSWSYDAYNRATSFTNAAGYVIQYRYDNNGNVTSLIYPGNRPVYYYYDSNNRLTNVTDWAGRQTTFSYDLAGHLTGISRPNNTLRSMAYDADGELTNIVERTTDQFPIAFFTLHYNPAGRIDWEFKGPLPHTNTPPTRTMTYDQDNRLKTFNGANVTIDNGGNLTYGPLTNNTFGTNTYDARNELTSAGGVSYGYDPSGTRASTWDGANAMQFVTDPRTSQVLMRLKNPASTNLIFEEEIYPGICGLFLHGTLPMGLNTGSTFTLAGFTGALEALNGDWTCYFAESYGGGNYLVDFLEDIGVNSGTNQPGVLIYPPVSSALTSYYVSAPGLGLLYEVDETARTTNLLYYHFDCRGSTIALTDVNGNPTDLIEYSPYGMTTYHAGTNITPFLFNGQFGVQTDPNGLLYMRARYYNPYISRFLNPDPSGFSGGLNFYAYANGNPISETDPFGLGAVGDNASYSWIGQVNTTGSGIFPSGPFPYYNGTGLGSDLLAGVANLGSLLDNTINSVGNTAFTAANMAGQFLGYLADKSGQSGIDSTSVAMISGLGILGEAAAAEGEGTVQIFRAVGQSESSSILNAGTYGSAPSMGGKYFALTQQGAQDFANASFNAGRQMSVTSTTIPQSVFNQGFFFNDVGGAGASIHFQQDFLPTLYNSMTPIKFH